MIALTQFQPMPVSAGPAVNRRVAEMAPFCSDAMLGDASLGGCRGKSPVGFALRSSYWKEASR